jgi:Rrf2 family protein
MATKLDIPMPFLWKILRKLSEEKLVRSFKGVRGGYELARPAKNIRVSEVLAAGRDGDQMGRCVLGLDKCDDQDPCPLHSQWKHLRKQMESRFQVTTLPIWWLWAAKSGGWHSQRKAQHVINLGTWSSSAGAHRLSVLFGTKAIEEPCDARPSGR